MKDNSAAAQVIEFPTHELQLDTQNPRFAGELGGSPNQTRMLDFIADTIGIADLLSSMSKRGYYRSHPLIAVKEGDKLVVVEGNRRLAAALILTDDERASNQKTRARNYVPSPEVRKKLEQLPVLVAETREEVLPYLGIAHIVGNKKWDSYAKAAWAVDVLDKNIYRGGIREVAEEIGDKHRTLERLVQALRLVRQLQAAGLFSPDDTIRKGKGIAKFPFSWVYTALGYQSVREWLGLRTTDEDEDRSYMNADIIPAEYLDRASELLTWMFGNRTKALEPVIQESRQIADIAASLRNDRRLALLRRGHSIDDAKRESQPPDERIADALLTAEQSLREILGLLGSAAKEIPGPKLLFLSGEAQKVASAAVNVYRQIRSLNEPNYDEQLA